MTKLVRVGLGSLALLFAACGQPEQVTTGETLDSGMPMESDAGMQQPVGLAVLGRGTHSLENVNFKLFAGPSEGLNKPRDLAFNPESPTDLWIPNYADSSMVILKKAGTPQQTKLKKNGFGNLHFMPRPSALAFGASNRMATAHEEDRKTQSTTPADFMGPTLWPTDDSFEGGHASHMDMLHNSPLAAGIAWERANIYWVFDGYHNAITKYDFASDHGPGGEDHSDGVIARFAEGQVSFIRGVASHMEFDHTNKRLYIADTGNRRIAVLDTTAGTRGPDITPNYDQCEQYRQKDAVIATFVGGDANGPLRKPSGLALRDGLIWVSDNETSKVLAFDANAQLVDWLDLAVQIPPGSLMGIEFDAQGNLYVVDEKASQVFQVAPKPQN